MNWKCPNCDAYNEESLEFCDICGSPKPSEAELRAAREEERARAEAAMREEAEAERREREEAERRAAEERRRRKEAERREREAAARRHTGPAPSPTPAPTPDPVPGGISSSHTADAGRRSAEAESRAAREEAERRERAEEERRERLAAERRRAESLRRAAMRSLILRIILIAAIVIVVLLVVVPGVFRFLTGRGSDPERAESSQGTESSRQAESSEDAGETSGDAPEIKKSAFDTAVEKRRSEIPGTESGGTDDGTENGSQDPGRQDSVFFDTVKKRELFHENQVSEPADPVYGIGYVYGRFIASDENLTRDIAPVLEFYRDGTFSMLLNFTGGFQSYEGTFTASDKEYEMDSVYLTLTVKDPSNGIPDTATVVFDDSPDYCLFMDEGFGLMGYSGAPYMFYSEEFYDLNESCLQEQ